MKEHSAIYVGAVVHQRTRPRRHRLRYRVFSLLLDIDEIQSHAARLRLLGHNTFGVFSFFDCDHGDGHGDLRRWVEDQLTAAGLAPDNCTIRMLCYPRIFGYVFNPLTVYFCYARGGELIAILYEVSNRYLERHTYVIRASHPATTTVLQTCRKAFYVSPFIPMNCTYQFRIALPGESVSVLIKESDEHGPFLTAAFCGSRRPLSDMLLLRMFFAYPLMTLKVTFAIYWEAIRLFLKRVPMFSYNRPQATVGVSIVDTRHE